MTQEVAGPKSKLDQITAEAVDLARQAATEHAEDFGVGEYLGCVVEGVRIVTHMFSCTHPGYPGWHWAVTLVRAARAKTPTVSEVVLLPGQEALVAKKWVPWRDRLQAEDMVPGTVLPTADNDPRLQPGFNNTDLPDDMEPAQASQIRAVANELGLGRERVLSAYGKDQAVVRWYKSPGGPKNLFTKLAPGTCVSCGYFIRLSGALGNVFGVCANEHSPFDAKVTACDHGCGGHSDTTEKHRSVEVKLPVYDTISPEQANLFD